MGDNILSTNLFYQIKKLTVFILLPVLLFSISIPSVIQADVSFDAAINITNDTNDSNQIRLASTSSALYYVWRNNTGSSAEIFLIASKDNGVTFGSPINLSSASRDSLNPQVNASGAKLFVTWEDERDEDGVSSVYFTNTTNNGDNTFTPLRLDTGSGTPSPNCNIWF